MDPYVLGLLVAFLVGYGWGVFNESEKGPQGPDKPTAA